MSNFNTVTAHYRKIQEEACAILEQCETSATFTRDPWNKKIGQGLTRIIQGGDKIEKGAINFSEVEGQVSNQMAQALEIEGSCFKATGVSSIFHPKNPFSPIIHMNIRYFELDNGNCWFGGGIDLSPHYIDRKQAGYFHRSIKKVCDDFNADYYALFKKQADEYFYLTHRNETRGVGGIFFDHLKPVTKQNFNELLNFTVQLGALYPRLYSQLLDDTYSAEYQQKNKDWQDIRRSRYVEFNLLFDRGTKFGLESGGNTESILASMPPQAKWAYNFEPDKDSYEEETLSLLKKGINWLQY